METNKCYNIDCMEFMSKMSNNSVNFTLTDIPYDEVARKTCGLEKMKNLDTLGAADKLIFDIPKFLDEVYRISSNSICIFCGLEQFSSVVQFFKSKPGNNKVFGLRKIQSCPFKWSICLSFWCRTCCLV